MALKTTGMSAYRLIDILAVMGILSYAATAALRPLEPSLNNDVWIHILTGRRILDTGHIPTVDEYSFTAIGRPYIAHEWLAALAYAASDRAWSAPGVIVVGSLVPTLLTLTALMATLKTLGVRARIALPVMLVAVTAARWRMFPRPEAYALALASLFVWILTRFRANSRASRGPGALLALVPLQVLWANTHASFVLGPLLVVGAATAQLADTLFGIRSVRTRTVSLFAGVALALGALAIGAYDPSEVVLPSACLLLLMGMLIAVDARAPVFAAACSPSPRKSTWLGITALLVALAPVATPWGLAIYRFPLEFTLAPNLFVKNVTEFAPLLSSTTFRSSLAFSAFGLLCMLWIFALARGVRAGRVERWHAGLGAVLAVLVLQSVRWMPLFALATAPGLSATLALFRPENSRRSRVRSALAVLLFTAAGGLALWTTALLSEAATDALLGVIAASVAGIAMLAASEATWPGIAAGRSSWATALVAWGLTSVAVIAGLPEVPGYRVRPRLSIREEGPVGAVAYLERHGVAGRAYTEYEWAGYLLHALWPRVTTFIDSRGDVYPDSLLMGWYQAKQSRSVAKEVLDRYDVDIAIVGYRRYPHPGATASNSGILGFLESSEKWDLVYVDDSAVVYERKRDASGRSALSSLRPRFVRGDALDPAAPEVQEALRAAISEAPGSATLRVALASSLRNAGHIEESWREVLGALDLAPDDPLAAQLAGEIAAARGDTAGARKEFERAIRKMPEWERPRRALSKLGSAPSTSKR